MWNRWSILHLRGTTGSSASKLTKQTGHSSLRGTTSLPSLLFEIFLASRSYCLRAYLKLVLRLNRTRRMPTGLTRRSIDWLLSCSMASISFYCCYLSVLGTCYKTGCPWMLFSEFWALIGITDSRMAISMSASSLWPTWLSLWLFLRLDCKMDESKFNYFLALSSPRFLISWTSFNRSCFSYLQ